MFFGLWIRTQDQIINSKREISNAETELQTAQLKIKNNTEQLKKKQIEMKKTEAEYKRDSSSLGTIGTQKIQPCIYKGISSTVQSCLATLIRYYPTPSLSTFNNRN